MNNTRLLITSFVVALLIITGAIIYATSPKNINRDRDSELALLITPTSIALPIQWGDLGVKMVNAGVIDSEQFIALYESRTGLTTNEMRLLESTDNGNLVIDSKNASYILNLLWALGLSNKNPILENGPMADPRYGGPDRFASTAGWTLAHEDAMGHYSKHQLIALTPQQQRLVESASKNIYRPCCDNPTHFPDCNHGMAMLGLLELMAAQNIGEEEMYEIALRVNSLWFQNQYASIGQYVKAGDIVRQNMKAKQILGKDFSSANGYKQILTQIESSKIKNNGGCAI
ncbi:MAG: hypothetical protein Q8Q37_00955 [bacterium]|nr:hypothetical protein [bacterium]